MNESYSEVKTEWLDGYCFENRYHPTKTRCPKRAKWKGKGTGNYTDEWQWCDDHAPDEPFREAI